MNFKKQTLLDKLPEWIKLDVGLGNKDSTKINKKINLSLKGKINQTERWLIRMTAGVFMLTIIYSAFSIYLDNKIKDKIADAQDVINYTNEQIILANSDISLIKQKANRYQEMENNLRNINNKIEDDLSLKGSIPNLLMRIMSAIPQQVQITEIENTTDSNNRHIIINAQSRYYDELGYFKAKLKEDGILTNVVSTQGQKEGDFVKIVIEGDLP